MYRDPYVVIHFLLFSRNRHPIYLLLVVIIYVTSIIVSDTSFSFFFSLSSVPFLSQLPVPTLKFILVVSFGTLSLYLRISNTPEKTGGVNFLGW